MNWREIRFYEIVDAVAFELEYDNAVPDQEPVPPGSIESVVRSVEALDNKFSIAIARLDAQFATTESISSVEADIRDLQTAREHFDKERDLYISLYVAAETHRVETRNSLFKITAYAIAFSAALGLVGVQLRTDLLRSVEKRTGEVEKKFDDRIRKLSDFGYNYSRGSGLIASNHPHEAIPLLMECFEGNEYDESVLIPLLGAVDSDDDWITARQLETTIRTRDPAKYRKLANSTTWNNLAALQANLGVSDNAYMNLAKDSIAHAEALEKVNDIDGRVARLKTDWVIGVLSSDTARMDRAIARLKVPELVNNGPIEKWETVRNWRALSEYFRGKPQELARAERSWKSLEISRKE